LFRLIKDHRSREKARKKPKPRRELISDPDQTYELYEPDESYDQYWPQLPLPESPTVFERVRRAAWIMMVSGLGPLILTVLVRFVSPDEPVLPEVQLYLLIGCAFCFVVAYSEQLFIGGDH
jgi:hypothetical protein